MSQSPNDAVQVSLQEILTVESTLKGVMTEISDNTIPTCDAIRDLCSGVMQPVYERANGEINEVVEKVGVFEMASVVILRMVGDKAEFKQIMKSTEEDHEKRIKLLKDSCNLIAPKLQILLKLRAHLMRAPNTSDKLIEAELKVVSATLADCKSQCEQCLSLSHKTIKDTLRTNLHTVLSNMDILSKGLQSVLEILSANPAALLPLFPTASIHIQNVFTRQYLLFHRINEAAHFGNNYSEESREIFERSIGRWFMGPAGWLMPLRNEVMIGNKRDLGTLPPNIGLSEELLSRVMVAEEGVLLPNVSAYKIRIGSWSGLPLNGVAYFGNNSLLFSGSNLSSSLDLAIPYSLIKELGKNSSFFGSNNGLILTLLSSRTVDITPKNQDNFSSIQFFDKSIELYFDDQHARDYVFTLILNTKKKLSQLEHTHFYRSILNPFKHTVVLPSRLPLSRDSAHPPSREHFHVHRVDLDWSFYPLCVARCIRGINVVNGVIRDLGERVKEVGSGGGIGIEGAMMVDVLSMWLGTESRPWTSFSSLNDLWRQKQGMSGISHQTPFLSNPYLEKLPPKLIVQRSVDPLSSSTIFPSADHLPPMKPQPGQASTALGFSQLHSMQPTPSTPDLSALIPVPSSLLLTEYLRSPLSLTQLTSILAPVTQFDHSTLVYLHPDLSILVVDTHSLQSLWTISQLEESTEILCIVGEGRFGRGWGEFIQIGCRDVLDGKLLDGQMGDSRVGFRTPFDCDSDEEGKGEEKGPRIFDD